MEGLLFRLTTGVPSSNKYVINTRIQWHRYTTVTMCVWECFKKGQRANQMHR